MAAVVHQAVYGSTGVYWRLPPEAQKRIGYWSGDRWVEVTPIDVVAKPESIHLAALQQEGIKIDLRREKLLGLWTLSKKGQSHIWLFADDIQDHGADPGDVAIHEIGHAAFDQPDYYGHDHSAGVTASGDVVAVEAAELGCGGPFCKLDTHLADVTMNLDGLRQRAHLQHRIPEGLGGRIPEARMKLQVASSFLVETATFMPDREGQRRMIQDRIDAVQIALAGDSLSPDDVSRAYALSYQAWDASYDYGHAWQLRRKGVA
jgi:hypothetical protein